VVIAVDRSQHRPQVGKGRVVVEARATAGVVDEDAVVTTFSGCNDAQFVGER
jgi:hypothetical protein